MEIVKINPVEFGLQEQEVATIEAAFLPKIAEREALVTVYETLITQELTPVLCSQAGDLRRKLVKVRTGIADIHKTQKAFLAAGRLVDAWKKQETAPVEQMETKLSEIETYYEKIEAIRVAKLQEERVLEVSKYTENIPSGLGFMVLEVYNAMLSGLKLAYEAKIEAEKQAEEKRIEAEKAEAEERERIRLENEKLKVEAAEKEKELSIERAKAAAEKAKADAELKEAQNKAAAELKAQQEKAAAEAKKAADEKAKLEKELADKAAAEKAKADAEAAKLKAAAMAPDKDKLNELIKTINSIQFPKLATSEAYEISANVKNLLTKVTNYITEKSNLL